MAKHKSHDVPGWPKSGAPAAFAALTAPLRAAFGAAYVFERRGSKSIPWSGPSLGWSEQATCPDVKEALSKRGLAEVEESGRDALDELIRVAVQLGIEQGRRVERRERAVRFGTVSGLLDILAKRTKSVEGAGGLIETLKGMWL